MGELNTFRVTMSCFGKLGPIHLCEDVLSNTYLCGEKMDPETLHYMSRPTPRYLVGHPQRLHEIEDLRAKHGGAPVCTKCADTIYMTQKIKGAGLYG